MATPSLAMIPSAYADSKVYSVLPNNGDGDFTFNRDSSATRVGQNGLIQTVGYFGSELVTNGDFATDSDWNKNAGWTISGGTANCDGTANNAIAQNFSLPTGTLRIKFDITARTQGGVNLWINKPAFTQLLSVDAVGSYEVDVVTTSGANNIYFYSASNFSGSIDNVSVQQILGDQPRLNYDISNGVVQSCPALLLEPASTNLIPYSENFNSGWTQYGSPTINTSSVISPDGTLNGSNITRGSNATPLRYQSLTSTGTQYTFSLYAKKGSVDKIYLDIGDVAEVEFTLTDEWQRFEITQTPPTFTHIDISFGTSISGDNFYIFGAQLEALSYATSYIPTAGSSQTRAAETCNDAGTASTFNSTEGVLYAEIESFISQDTVDPNRYITITNGTSNERVAILFGGNNNQLRAIIFSSSQSINLSFTTSLTEVKQFNKLALRYKSGDYAFYVNGVEIGSSTESTIFSSNILNDLSFDVGGGSLPFYGKCKDLRVYNEALTDAQLQTLTTL
jgi:hypothetical protein